MLGMTCHVYMIVADMNSLPVLWAGRGDKVPFKIGVAVDIKSRLTSLQIGCPLALSVHNAWTLQDRSLARLIEARVHEDFDPFRISGEWFFHTSLVALDGISKIFDEVGLKQRSVRPKKDPPVPVVYDGNNPFEKRVLQLIEEFGKEFGGKGTPAIQHAAHLTAVAEKARWDFDHDETDTITERMVERAEDRVVEAMRALMTGKYDERLGDGPPRPFIRNVWSGRNGIR